LPGTERISEDEVSKAFSKEKRREKCAQILEEKNVLPVDLDIIWL
jgi:hypothetical protein